MSCGDWICNDGFVLWLTVLITATKLMAIRLWEGYSHYIPGRSFRSPEITGTGSSIPVEKRWDFSQQIPINFLCFPTGIGQNLSEKFRKYPIGILLPKKPVELHGNGRFQAGLYHMRMTCMGIYTLSSTKEGEECFLWVMFIHLPSSRSNRTDKLILN